MKIDIEKSYYHVYIRGHSGQAIFRDDDDYIYFLSLFGRYLSVESQTDSYGKQYRHLRGEIEIISYCLLANEFHLLIHQTEQGAMSKLMKSVLTAYSRYFNKKYLTSGSLFESRYKASRIATNKSLLHISRYIHLASGDWQAHPYSSIHAYFGIGQSDWLQQDRLVDLFPSLPHYADFLDNSSDYEKSLLHIAEELANSNIIK